MFQVAAQTGEAVGLYKEGSASNEAQPCLASPPLLLELISREDGMILGRGMGQGQQPVG